MALLSLVKVLALLRVMLMVCKSGVSHRQSGRHELCQCRLILRPSANTVAQSQFVGLLAQWFRGDAQ
jgi:hypothetical protein